MPYTPPHYKSRCAPTGRALDLNWGRGVQDWGCGVWLFGCVIVRALDLIISLLMMDAENNAYLVPRYDGCRE